MNIVVCGGGSMGHAIAGKLSLNSNTNISVLTRSPERWNKTIKIKYSENEITESKELFITSEASKVIPEANIIIISVPNFGIKEVIEQIAPFYNQKSWIGAIQCSGGFFWTLFDKLGKIERTFGFQRVPYICRTLEYGKSVHIMGNKSSIDLYYNHTKGSDTFKETIESLFDMRIDSFKHYLDVSISNSNPILHPSRLYSLFKDWNKDISYKKEFFFYEEWNDDSSNLLLECDNELSEIISKIPLNLSHITSIKQHYEVNNTKELTAKLQSIKAFKGISTSMLKHNDRFIPNFNNRYFTEDIPYGLLIIKGLALLTKVDTPIIDKILFWSQRHLELELLIDKNTLGKDSKKYPLPQSFEITDINDII